MKGLDISNYQSSINFDAIKNSDVKFLILRAGFTGWGTGESLHIDDSFERFYAEAKSRDIPVGAYWYSCANTYDEGVREANYMIENCLKGKQFEYPIYIDVEDTHHQINTPKATTDACIGFCKTMEAQGYYVGIYANLNWFNNILETSRLNAYDKWLACWCGEAPSTSFDYNMWQYTSDGSINGYNGRLDTNESYIDFPSIMKSRGLNGFGKAPQPVEPTNPLDEYSDVELAIKVWDNEFGVNPEIKEEVINHLYAKVLFIGKVDSIDNYVEVPKVK